MKVKTLTVVITREALCDKFLQVLFKDTFYIVNMSTNKSCNFFKKNLHLKLKNRSVYLKIKLIEISFA